MVSSADPVSRERVHVDGREGHVMQDVDAVDLVDLSDTVLKFKGGCVVDDHLELSEGAEDLHLQRDVKVTAVTLASSCQSHTLLQNHTRVAPSLFGRSWCFNPTNKRESFQHFDFRQMVLEFEPQRIVYLKVMSRHERKRPQKLPLLFPPTFPQFMIADQNRFSSFVESRVDVKGDIVTAQEVDREPCDRRNVSSTLFIDKKTTIP